jgi:hypothetical protein
MVSGDVKRPMKAEPPIVTIVKVKISGFTRSLGSPSN